MINTGPGGQCEEVDGCLRAPCFPGVECTDVKAPGEGRECGLCPPLTTGDGAICEVTSQRTVEGKIKAEVSSALSGSMLEMVRDHLPPNVTEDTAPVFAGASMNTTFLGATPDTFASGQIRFRLVKAMASALSLPQDRMRIRKVEASGMQNQDVGSSARKLLDTIMVPTTTISFDVLGDEEMVKATDLIGSDRPAMFSATGVSKMLKQKLDDAHESMTMKNAIMGELEGQISPVPALISYDSRAIEEEYMSVATCAVLQGGSLSTDSSALDPCSAREARLTAERAKQISIVTRTANTVEMDRINLQDNLRDPPKPPPSPPLPPTTTTTTSTTAATTTKAPVDSTTGVTTRSVSETKKEKKKDDDDNNTMIYIIAIVVGLVALIGVSSAYMFFKHRDQPGKSNSFRSASSRSMKSPSFNAAFDVTEKDLAPRLSAEDIQSHNFIVPNEDKEIDAATAIQRHYRGYSTRKRSAEPEFDVQYVQGQDSFMDDAFKTLNVSPNASKEEIWLSYTSLMEKCQNQIEKAQKGKREDGTDSGTVDAIISFMEAKMQQIEMAKQQLDDDVERARLALNRIDQAHRRAVADDAVDPSLQSQRSGVLFRSESVDEGVRRH